MSSAKSRAIGLLAANTRYAIHLMQGRPGPLTVGNQLMLFAIFDSCHAGPAVLALGLQIVWAYKSCWSKSRADQGKWDTLSTLMRIRKVYIHNVSSLFRKGGKLGENGPLEEPTIASALLEWGYFGTRVIWRE
jgi:hypothetical protein